jgi:hypothetical protein
MTKTKSYVPIEDDFSGHPQESNPDPKAFAELTFTRSSRTSCLLSTLGPKSKPLLAVTISNFTPGKPSVTLHSDPTQDSAPLGLVKLGFWRTHNIALCTKAHGNDEENATEMEWMKLVRVKMRTLKKFEFEYDGKMYMWTTIKAYSFGERPDMELREKGEGEMPLLAFYKGETRKGKLRTGRGVFFLKGKSWDEAGDMELGKWELVVLLTGMGDVEVAAREAARRKTAVG